MSDRGSFATGDTALVFDARLWGGQDVGDNSQFWQPCVLRHLYRKRGDLLAAVSWPNGRTSQGHIVSMMRPAPTTKGPGRCVVMYLLGLILMIACFALGWQARDMRQDRIEAAELSGVVAPGDSGA
jgi:hypothetical protein